MGRNGCQKASEIIENAKIVKINQKLVKIQYEKDDKRNGTCQRY